MKVTELMELVGEKLVTQWLHDSLIGMSQGKGGTRVTFGTDQVSALKELTGSNEKVALICWIPREIYDQAFPQQSPKPPPLPNFTAKYPKRPGHYQSWLSKNREAHRACPDRPPKSQ